MDNVISMNEFKVTTINSREVAKMVEKNHADLLRDIKTYIEYLGESNFAFTDFFMLSEYKTAQNKIQPCYEITRKGCEFIAHKMTGQKGALFTAKYINHFHEMEKEIFSPIDRLSPQLQFMINMELKQKELENRQEKTEHRLDSIREIVGLSPIQWRKDTANLVNKIAYKLGGTEHIEAVRNEIYDLLEQRFGVRLKIRLNNMRKEMALNGASRSKRDKLNRLDVISEDKKLIEGYISIVKDMAIKHGVDIVA